MIVLDTHVLSELIKRKPAREVTTWLKDLADTPVATTEINVAEVLAGLALLPSGRRRRVLEQAFLTVMQHAAFTPLPFDREAALAYAAIREQRKRAGLHHAPLDHLIAAIARAAGAAVATRNVAGFEGCGIEVIDPWERNGAAD